MTRLIVFDLDGTLVDSSRDLATAVNGTLERLRPGTPALPLDVVRSYIGEGAGRLVSQSLARAQVQVAPETALAVFLEIYAGCLLETTRPYPGVPAALQALSSSTLAVLTNKPGGFSRTILQGLGLLEPFAAVVGGDEMPARKPDPAALLLLTERFQASAAETLFVGDSAVDVATARAAGVRVVGVSYGLDPEGLKAARPDLLLDDLAQLWPDLASGSVLR
jgi:phosphoglycolate phosphatase